MKGHWGSFGDNMGCLRTFIGNWTETLIAVQGREGQSIIKVNLKSNLLRPKGPKQFLAIIFSETIATKKLDSFILILGVYFTSNWFIANVDCRIPIYATKILKIDLPSLKRFKDVLCTLAKLWQCIKIHLNSYVLESLSNLRFHFII